MALKFKDLDNQVKKIIDSTDIQNNINGDTDKPVSDNAVKVITDTKLENFEQLTEATELSADDLIIIKHGTVNYTGKLANLVRQVTLDTYNASDTTNYPINTAVLKSVVDSLDVSEIGGSGKYITAISETDGIITASESTLDTSIATASTSTNAPTSAAVATFVAESIAAIPAPMEFKGSLGTGGTITSLPTASRAVLGYTYKVITAGTYDTVTVKVGDLVVCSSSGTGDSVTYAWTVVPSGDEPDGTVTSITLVAGSGISLDTDNTAITTSGTRTITNSGVRSVATGSANGTISVNTNGSASDVAVKGLGSSSYRDVTASVTSGSEDVITSGAVYNVVNNCTNVTGSTTVTPSGNARYYIGTAGVTLTINKCGILGAVVYVIANTATTIRYPNYAGTTVAESMVAGTAKVLLTGGSGYISNIYGAVWN